MPPTLPLLLLIPILISLFFLAAPATLLSSIVLLLFFDLRKIKEIFSILFTALLFFLGLLGKVFYLLFTQQGPLPFTFVVRSLLTCSLTLAAFILIKFTLFMYKENR